MSETQKQAIPMEQWGRDHWSTLAFIESRCVNYGGDMIADRGHERMRCNFEIHPGLRGGNGQPDGADAPTRLKDGSVVHEHDDWSCAEDMESSGLLEWKGTGTHPVFVLTELGIDVAGQLRAHKARGGGFKNFEPAVFTEPR